MPAFRLPHMGFAAAAASGSGRHAPSREETSPIAATLHLAATSPISSTSHMASTSALPAFKLAAASPSYATLPPGYPSRAATERLLEMASRPDPIPESSPPFGLTPTLTLTLALALALT